MAWRDTDHSEPREQSTSRRATESAPPETAVKTVSPPWSIPERRMAATASARRSVSVIVVALQAHPHVAVFEELLLPHRQRRLERVDGEAAGVEGLGPVGRRYRDHHARLADLEPADPVHQRHPRPALPYRRRDLSHLGRSHRLVGLVLQILDPPATGLLADYPREEHEAARPRLAHGPREARLGQRLTRDFDQVGGGPPAHRGEEAHLVSGTKGVAGRDVIGAESEQRERAVRLKDREAARNRFPGRLDRPALRKIQLDVVATRRFAVAGEEADGDLHMRRSRTGGKSRTHRTTSRWGC